MLRAGRQDAGAAGRRLLHAGDDASSRWAWSRRSPTTRSHAVQRGTTTPTPTRTRRPSAGSSRRLPGVPVRGDLATVREVGAHYGGGPPHVVAARRRVPARVPAELSASRPVRRWRCACCSRSLAGGRARPVPGRAAAAGVTALYLVAGARGRARRRRLLRVHLALPAARPGVAAGRRRARHHDAVWRPRRRRSRTGRRARARRHSRRSTASRPAAGHRGDRRLQRGRRHRRGARRHARDDRHSRPATEPLGQRRSSWSTAAPTTPRRSPASTARTCARCRANRGQGAALRLGYYLARAGGARYIVTTDADGQYDIDAAAPTARAAARGEADFVTGSRRLGDDESRDQVRRTGVRRLRADRLAADPAARDRHLVRLPGDACRDHRGTSRWTSRSTSRPSC